VLPEVRPVDGLEFVAGLGVGLFVPQRQRAHRVDATGEQVRPMRRSTDASNTQPSRSSA
jgi:hypothetical protein